MNRHLINYLSNFVKEKRYNLFNQIIKSRTKYITVLLEDIYQSHNASAVLRTCDCFGIQDVHIIENNNEYQINPDVTLGSNKWLNLHRYNKEENNTESAIKKLKEKGYRIVATTPHTTDTPLENYDLSKGKTALLFGSELRGLSNIAIKNADEFLKIPMYGFTESFNISVSAAIILHHLKLQLTNSNINWKLTKEEEDGIIVQWLKNTIKDSERIVKRFYEEQTKK